MTSGDQTKQTGRRNVDPTAPPTPHHCRQTGRAWSIVTLFSPYQSTPAHSLSDCQWVTFLVKRKIRKGRFCRHRGTRHRLYSFALLYSVHDLHSSRRRFGFVPRFALFWTNGTRNFCLTTCPLEFLLAFPFHTATHYSWLFTLFIERRFNEWHHSFRLARFYSSRVM